MGVNLRVGPIAYPIGTAAFLGSFFTPSPRDWRAVYAAVDSRCSRGSTARGSSDPRTHPPRHPSLRSHARNSTTCRPQPSSGIWMIRRPVRPGEMTSPRGSRTSSTTSSRPTADRSSRCWKAPSTRLCAPPSPSRSDADPDRTVGGRRHDLTDSLRFPAVRAAPVRIPEPPCGRDDRRAEPAVQSAFLRCQTPNRLPAGSERCAKMIAPLSTGGSTI